MRDAKQRLRSLDRIDPPDVWHRAGTMEPLGDVPDTVGQPPWQRRVAAGAVAFAVFGVAVALALGAFGRDDPRVGIGDATPLPADVVVTFEVIETNDSSHPSATMTAGDATVDGVITSFSWTSGNSQMNADTLAPEFRDEDHVPVPASATMQIEGDADRVTGSLLEPGTYRVHRDRPLDRRDRLDGPSERARPVRHGVHAGLGAGLPHRTTSRSRSVAPEESPALEPGTLAPIEVTTPARDAVVTSPVTIAGTADVFEGTVTIWIVDGMGNRIASTFATATCGNGCRGDFSVEVPYSVGTPQPGQIVVFEESAEDGKHLHTVRIPVTLRPGAEDPVAEAVEGPWTDEQGNPLADGTDRGNDYALTIHTLEGADHCGLTSVTFLHLAWPLGTTTTDSGETRQYVRDPHEVLAGLMSAPFESGTRLPDDAAATGYHRGDWELWVAPSDVDEAVYVVNGDPDAGGTWERWPRSTEPIGCI